MKEGRHSLLSLHKQVHDKRGIAESQHEYISMARLTACEVGVFLKYHNYQNYAHLHLVENYFGGRYSFPVRFARTLSMFVTLWVYFFFLM